MYSLEKKKKKKNIIGNVGTKAASAIHDMKFKDMSF